MKAKLVSVLLAVLLALPLLGGDWTSGQYRYDGAGNIVAIGTHTYGYDAAGRLTGAKLSPAVTHEYQYDPYGNRTAYAVNQQWVTVPTDPASNQLTDAAYDAAGNQLARGATSAAFDGFGMVTGYRFDAVNAETFVYNANDERIGVLRGNEWTWSFRDAGGRVLRQYRSSATSPNAPWLWVEDFVHRGPLLLGSERPAAEGGRRHYHLDHLGSPRLVTSDSGAVLSEHDFLPFGEERTPVAQQVARGFERESPHRFTGHERDFDTATPNDSSAYVDAMHARYYAATTGRFLSVDPTWESADAAKPQSWNRYSYVLNDPVNLADPDGKCPTCMDADELAGAAWATTAEFVKDYVLLDGDGPLFEPGASLDADKPDLQAAAALGTIVSEQQADVPGRSRPSTLSPGPHADESIPARSPQPKFTREERTKMNDAGRKSGCHTCGSTDPGTRSGNFVPDHQPPSATRPPAQRLYPHCINCSRAQGGAVRQLLSQLLRKIL